MTQCLNPDCLHQNRPGTNFCARCGSLLLLGDRYRALEIIGQGGFGRTFKARDEYKPSKPLCVIKQFLPQGQETGNEQKAAELFKQEAVRLESLGKHDQIPELFAYFSQQGQQYLVQEFIDGQNLQQELQQGTFAEEQIEQLLTDLLPVLQFCQERQVIHRDIKPENIIRRKSDLALVLVDFGAAKLATQSALTRKGTIVGSAGYIAPEQLLGKATFASDIYSLAVTCINLMTGIDPVDLFDADRAKWLWQEHLSQKPSKQLRQLLNKMLQPGVKRRYQSAKEVLMTLNLLVLPGQITPVTPNKVSPLPTKIVPSRLASNISLESARGIDYSRLRDLLAAGNWQEADIETGDKMLEVMGRTAEGWLGIEDIENFPWKDLRTIDRLWVKASSDRFGFSVQSRIYKQLGGTITFHSETWKTFGEIVGWRKGGEWIRWSDLTFDSTAPPAHLPLGGWVWEFGCGFVMWKNW